MHVCVVYASQACSDDSVEAHASALFTEGCKECTCECTSWASVKEQKALRRRVRSAVLPYNVVKTLVLVTPVS